MSDCIYVLVWKSHDGKFNLTRAFENKNLLEYYANKNGFELIIIATHGRSGLTRWVLGSVADRVLRSACVPVLMIRAPGCEPSI